MKDYTSQFAALHQQANGHPLAYLDSAATSMRPNEVLQAVTNFYQTIGANPHRGIHTLGAKATLTYENARETTAEFIGALNPDEVIFTRNATEALNLVAFCYAAVVLKPGDSIVITIAEHHSNLVPWQRAAQAAGANLVYMYTNAEGELPDEELNKIDATTRIVAFTHISNVLGTVMPVQKLVARAKAVGAVTVLDCAQSVPHMPVDVHALDVDFAAFSGHKMYAPMGIGVLYGRMALLQDMPPFLAGGDMIEYVQEQSTTYALPPQRFEAGTQNAGGAVGLAAAIRFMQKTGWDEIQSHEAELMQYLTQGLLQTPHIDIIGTHNPQKRHGVVAFNVQDVHPHDVASIVDADGVAIRAGHHCTQPLMKYLGLNSSCRASLALYNTKKDIDALLAALPKARRWLGYAD